MKNNKSLLITLGHGSSAIFVDGENIIGYEQERISGIKSDSQFPNGAIAEIVRNVGHEAMKGCNIFVSHWFNCISDKYKFEPSKYMTHMDYENLLSISDNIRFVDRSFTHHDAHAYSAAAFFNYHYDKRTKHMQPLQTKQVWTIVADGFGTNKEVISIYEAYWNKSKQPKLVHRVYGYGASLGLMYQYATSFCGMKENQDEYKFLGYEAYIDHEFGFAQIELLKELANSEVKRLLQLAETNTEPVHVSEHDLIDTEELAQTKENWYSVFDRVIYNLGIDRNKEESAFVERVAIAYFIQSIVEKYFVALVKQYGMHNVLCVGGCFYNVKLNNAILENIDGLFSVMPLAGDQGAAIGMYSAFTGEQFSFDTLAIGKRSLYNAEKLLKDKPGIEYRQITDSETIEHVAQEIAQQLADGNIVNIIFGGMEFGPRALCNTSTLMLPTAENVAHNNHMNNRNEVMPCAPVCTFASACELFDAKELNRVIGSDRFMICTHTYTKPYSKQYAGVMHKKPLCVFDEYTGRPQIVRPNSLMDMILNNVSILCDAKCLVNTSFNVHGRPIVFDLSDILQNFEYQQEHATFDKKPLLYVIDSVK